MTETEFKSFLEELGYSEDRVRGLLIQLSSGSMTLILALQEKYGPDALFEEIAHEVRARIATLLQDIHGS